MLERLRRWYKRLSAAPSIPDGLRFYALPRSDGLPFEFGVELRNDEVTPLPFVVRALQEEAKLTERDACAVCAIAHEKGGVLFPTSSLQAAEEAAMRIVSRARREAWPLQCKAVSAPRTGKQLSADPPLRAR